MRINTDREKRKRTEMIPATVGTARTDSEGKLSLELAENILPDRAEALLCAEDALLSTGKDASDSCFAYPKAVRELALKRYFAGANDDTDAASQVLSELQESLPSANMLEISSKEETAGQIFDAFLSSLSKRGRKIFMRRYWYVSSLSDIASDFLLSEKKVCAILFRLRKRLRWHLEKRGFYVPDAMKLMLALNTASGRHAYESAPTMELSRRTCSFIGKGAVAACVCALIFSVCTWLFTPLGPKVPDVSEYSGSEYYSDIEKINSCYAEYPAYGNNYLIFANHIYNAMHAENRTQSRLDNTHDILSYHDTRDGNSDGVDNGELLFVKGDYAIYVDSSYYVYSYKLDGKGSTYASHVTPKLPYGYIFNGPYYSGSEAFISEDGNVLTVVNSCKCESGKTSKARQRDYIFIYSIDVSDPARIKLINGTAGNCFIISGERMAADMVDGRLLIVSGFYHDDDFSDPYNFLPFCNAGGDDVFIHPTQGDIPNKRGECMITSVHSIDPLTLSPISSYSALAFTDAVYVSESNVYLSFSYTETHESDTRRDVSLMTSVAVIGHTGGELKLRSVFSVHGTVKGDSFSFSEKDGILRILSLTHDVSYDRSVSLLGISRYKKRDNTVSVSLYCIDPNSGSVISSLDRFIQYKKEPYFSPCAKSARFDGDKLYFIGATGSNHTCFCYTVDLSDVGNITYSVSEAIANTYNATVGFGEGQFIGFDIPDDYVGYTSLYVYKEGVSGALGVLGKSKVTYYFGRSTHTVFTDVENSLIGFVTSGSEGDRRSYRYVIFSFDGQDFVEVFTTSSKETPERCEYNSSVFDSLRVHVTSDFLYLFFEGKIQAFKLP